VSRHLLSPIHGGEVFCAAEECRFTEGAGTGRAWVWVSCAEYYAEGEAQRSGAGMSESVMVDVICRHGRRLVTGCAAPESGESWAEDVRAMFPPRVVAKMCLEDTACHNERSSRLRPRVEQKAQAGLDLPLAPVAGG
jgi:hypothetical protein